MEYPDGNDGSWAQYHINTPHGSLGGETFDGGSFDGGSTLLGHHDAYGYRAPPTYAAPARQRASYQQFGIQDGGGAYNSQPRLSIQGPAKTQRRVTMKSPFRQSFYHLFCTVMASSIFAITAWFSQATFSANSNAQATNLLLALYNSFGPTIAMLRLLQGLTSTAITVVLNQAFERVQWSLASSHNGVRVLSLLSLSPATTLYGLFGIALGRRSKLVDRFWSFLKYIILQHFFDINYQVC